MKRASAVWTLAVVGVMSALVFVFDAPPVQAQDNAVGRGEQVYEYWCAPCHNPGPGHPGTQSLEIRYSGTEIPAVLMERTDLTPELVNTFVREGVLSMAPFRKTEITDDELDALAAYLTE